MDETCVTWAVDYYIPQVHQKEAENCPIPTSVTCVALTHSLLTLGSGKEPSVWEELSSECQKWLQPESHHPGQIHPATQGLPWLFKVQSPQ